MSRMQKPNSTTEAEYMALSTCAREDLWMTQLFRDMGLVRCLGSDLNATLDRTSGMRLTRQLS